MKPATMPGALMRALVGRLQAAFYPETVGVKQAAGSAFYRELRLLQKAVTFPARELVDKGWTFDAERYEGIFTEVIAKVKAHGVKGSKVRCRGAYILHCVQDHWAHHWDKYWEESKAVSAEAERALEKLRRRGEQAPPQVPLMEALAEAHQALTTGRPRKAGAREIRAAAKGQAGEIQQELF